MKYFEELKPHQRELIEKHLDLVIRENETTNLTRIDTRDEGLILHVEDSLSALPEMMEAPQGLYGDLGSGAGFPGIPLAIATGRKTVLIDSRQKKMKIMDGVIGELGLREKVRTFAGRAELLARKEPQAYSVLTARALSKLPVLMELASPLLKQGGRLVCYKAKLEDKELEQAKRIQKEMGMKIVSEREFVLEGKYERKIVTFEKISRPKVNLPRKEGEAQKHPLGES